MHNAFFIVGPTAVGKTGVALELAERVGAEIINADAYQIYQGFSLLTAKPTRKQQQQVVHHLLGHVDPTVTYNVAKFLTDATQAAEAVARNGRPVLVVGGNGLYVKALTHGLATLPESRPALRTELEETPLPELLERLRTLDPVAHETIDHQNGRRVIRALEVCLLAGQPFSSFQKEWRERPFSPVARGVFLTRDRNDLLARINRRVDDIFAQGVVDEVRRDGTQRLSSSAAQILGLADIQTYLSGKISLSACQERIKIATRQYAKRQVTWFKRETCFTPVNLSTDGNRDGRREESIREHFETWMNAIRSPKTR